MVHSVKKRVARRKTVQIIEPEKPMFEYVREIDLESLDVPRLSQMQIELHALSDAVDYELRRKRNVMAQIMRGTGWQR